MPLPGDAVEFGVNNHAEGAEILMMLRSVRRRAEPGRGAVIHEPSCNVLAVPPGQTSFASCLGQQRVGPARREVTGLRFGGVTLASETPGRAVSDMLLNKAASEWMAVKTRPPVVQAPARRSTPNAERGQPRPVAPGWFSNLSIQFSSLARPHSSGPRRA